MGCAGIATLVCMCRTLCNLGFRPCRVSGIPEFHNYSIPALQTSGFMERLVSRPRPSRRRQKFGLYAENLGRVVPGLDDLFACPLCLRSYGPEAADDGPDGEPLLTVEHVLPEGVGGSLTTLTCKECNSTDGANIDAHLVERFRLEDALTGRSGESIKARMRPASGGKELAVNWQVAEDGTLLFFGVPLASHPDAPDEIMEAMKAQQPMRFTFHAGYKHTNLRSRVSLLRSAYLLMFYYFGYGYLQYGSAEIVREQIRQYGEDLITKAAILSFETAPFPGEMNRLYAVHTPFDLRCFLAMFETDTAKKRYFGVIMPGLDTESAQVYNRWSALGKEVQGLQLSPLQIPHSPDLMIHPTSAMGAWNAVVQEGFGESSQRDLGHIRPLPSVLSHTLTANDD